MENQKQKNNEMSEIKHRIAANAASHTLAEASTDMDQLSDSSQLSQLLGEKISLAQYPVSTNSTIEFPTTPIVLHEQRTDVEPSKASYWQKKMNIVFGKDVSLKERLRAIPFIGYGVKWINAFIKLPVTRHHHQIELQLLRDQNHLLQHKLLAVNDRLSQTHQLINEMQARKNEEINASFSLVSQQLVWLSERIDAYDNAKVIRRVQQLELQDAGKRLMKIEQLALERKLKQFSQLMQMYQQDDVQRSAQYAALAQKMLNLNLSQENIENNAQSLQFKTSEKTQSTFDSHQFYVDFETKFRGEKEDIKERLKVYLPYLVDVFKDTHAQKEEGKFTLIDIGCGRGEWLSLMMEQDIASLGIDLNQAMVAECINAGYAAKVADAIEFLQAQEEASLAAITGFHIIEHLPFETLIALFDAAYKALKVGGVLIFETPNPENLIVGACNFYYDPTHIHPIVPVVAQFTAEQRGFNHAEILRLHPYPDYHRMAGDTDADKILNKYLFDAQDYALIARK